MGVAIYFNGAVAIQEYRIERISDLFQEALQYQVYGNRRNPEIRAYYPDKLDYKPARLFNTRFRTYAQVAQSASQFEISTRQYPWARGLIVHVSPAVDTRN